MARRFPVWVPWTVGIVGGALVLVGELVPIRASVEDSLVSRSVEALDGATVTYEDVSFSGRDGTVTGVDLSQVRQAEGLVAGLEGVRVVEVLDDGGAAQAARDAAEAEAVAEAEAAAQAEKDAAEKDAAEKAEADAAAKAQEEADAAAAARAAAEAEAAAAEAAAVAEAIAALPAVQFENARAVLAPSADAVLEAMAAALTAGPSGVVYEVRGYTDSSGDAMANQVLSERRASAVVVGLVARGVPAESLAAVGFGEKDPLVSPERSEADRAANRRVVVEPRGVEL